VRQRKPYPRRTVASRSARLPLDDLLLDAQNPRLVVDLDTTQEELLELLFEEESLDELVGSFIENGYFEEEPLVVVDEPEGHVVVEGNRRLATLKLLLSKKLRERVGADDWPTLSKTERDRLREVPVIVYDERSEVVPYLGFRHITGARKWGPFQKARFIARLVDEDYALEDIEGIVGDETKVVKRLYQEYIVFRQAAELEFPVRRVRRRFSLLEVTLSQRPIKTFLGIPHLLPSGRVDRVVPEEREDELIDVLTWVFGENSREAVITDSREIPTLARVIGNEDALEVLRRTDDLEAATEMVGGEAQFLLRRLGAAERGVRDASSLIALYADDADVVDAVKRLASLVEGLRSQVD
jgi:hypothetical protein